MSLTRSSRDRPKGTKVDGFKSVPSRTKPRTGSESELPLEEQAGNSVRTIVTTRFGFTGVYHGLPNNAISTLIHFNSSQLTDSQTVAPCAMFESLSFSLEPLFHVTSLFTTSVISTRSMHPKNVAKSQGAPRTHGPPHVQQCHGLVAQGCEGRGHTNTFIQTQDDVDMA